MKNDCIKHRFLIFSVCVSVFLLFFGASRSETDIPDDNLSYPVLLVSKCGTGSGFFYNKDDATYLITARHVLFKETTVAITKRFSVPKPLRHRLFINGNKPNKGFTLRFLGVMSQEERNILTRAVYELDDLNLMKAIDELYENSQNLRLRVGCGTLLTRLTSFSETKDRGKGG
jgi:hypothetical protein